MAGVTRALVLKVGLLLSSAGTTALGVALLVLQHESEGGWLTTGDRVAGVGLIVCGVVFAFFALHVRRDGAGAPASEPPPAPESPEA